MTIHVRCACSRADCINAIRVDSDGLWFNHEKSQSQEMLIYLDANGAVELIKRLRKFLIEKTESGTL